MEYKGLYPFVGLLIALGFLIGVGVLALDMFSTAQYVTGTTVNETHAWYNNTLITLTNKPILAITSVTNTSSVTMATTGYAIHNADLGQVIVYNNGTISDGETAKITYTYENYGATGTTLNAARGEISGIATNWLGLVITIFILAMIIYMVMSGFGGMRPR